MKLSVKSLHRYPIKSCRGVELDRAELDPYGFVGDRRYMVVDADDHLVTARVHPQMVLIRVNWAPSGVTVSGPGMEMATFERSDNMPTRRVRVWNDWCESLDMGDAPSEWFSTFLGMRVRLVFAGSQFHRPIDRAYNPGDRHVHFGDAYPLLVISTASLNDLNSRLDTALPMTRFRPNIVVEGCSPYEEDRWKTIRIGSVIVRMTKPCYRCVLTTVDPETAERGKEPLRTLSHYRRGKDGDVYFGQNVIHETLGVIHTGDPIEIMELEGQGKL